MTAIDWRAVQARLGAMGYDPGPSDGAPGMTDPGRATDVKTVRALLSLAANRDVGEFGVRVAPVLVAMLHKYGLLASAERLAQFLATTAHETGGYTAFSENLYYTTPSRLVANWPSRFNLASALLYLRNPRKLAERVYSYEARHGTPGDLGNRKGTDDAYAMRGGGWIQTTGYSNYLRAQQVTGLPLVEHPELLHDPLTSIEAACAYWAGVGCNALADADPTGRRSRLKVNGGTIGMADVLARTARMMKVLV